jgi:hypothetical protein
VSGGGQAARPDSGAASPGFQRQRRKQSLAAVDMRAVLDTTDVQHPVVFEYAERDAVIAAARHTPPFEFEPQRFGHPGRVARQRGGDEFGDRSSDFVRQPIE